MTKGDSEELQTLQRGLRVLRILNERGPINLAPLARELNIPRSNAYRLLHTLCVEGYVERVRNSRLYKLTPLVRRLSSGFSDDDLLTSVAAAPVDALRQKLVWPIALATPLDTHMLVRISTDHQSPVALVRTRPGYITPMLMATTGILYLAFSPAPVREDTISQIAAAGQLTPFYPDAAALQLVMKTARKAGYLLIDNRYREGSLGVPLIWRGRVLGGLVVRYIKTALTRRQATELLLPPLKAAAEDIISAFDEAILRSARDSASSPHLGTLGFRPDSGQSAFS
ncbi:MAG: helix-turn-helix domain-containing protein [Rhodospirillaceae bacterium]|nr:helix-turn-helix domain-containing protein [Rhodospirillaceae bacterium]